MPTIPSWLQAPDVAADYLRGLSVGTSVAQAKARLDAEAQRHAVETQMRQQQLEKQHAVQQQRLNVSKEYHDVQAGLQRQRLDQAAQINAAKTRDAATKAAAQQKFAGLLQAGMPTEKALFQVPELATPQAAIAARRAEGVDPGAMMQFRKDRLQLQRDQLQERQRQFDNPKKPELSATYNVPGETPYSPPKGTVRGPLPSLQERFGTNLPPVLRAPAPSASAGFKSANDVAAAYKAGKISRDEATKLLKDQFGLKD